MATFSHSLHLHPMLVHFPIALFIGALGFEIASLIFSAKGGSACGGKNGNLHRTALYLYLLAAVISPVVVQTGLWEEDVLKIHHPVLETHMNFALLTMWSSLVSLPALWIIKKKKPAVFRHVFLFCTLLTVTTVSIAAYNGGKMVYEYGIGIDEQ